MRKSAKRYASFPKSPMPKRPASDVGCNSTPLDLGKLTVTSAVMTAAIIQKRGSGVRGRELDNRERRNGEKGKRGKGETSRAVSAFSPLRLSLFPLCIWPPAPDTRPPACGMFII